MEIRSLNTLRGLAALMVVISHFSNTVGGWGELLGGGSGQLGVMLFFLLSGFLMAHLYWGKTPAARQVFAYAVARAARVLPLYFLVVLLSFLTPFGYPVHTAQALWMHLLLLRGVSVLWTIPTEVQFYLIFGVSWVCLSRRRAVLLPVLVVAGVGLYLLNYQNGMSGLTRIPKSFSVLMALPYFVSGCLLGRLYEFRSRFSEFSSPYWLLALAVILMLYPNLFVLLFGFHHQLWRAAWIPPTLSCVFFAVVFLVPGDNPLVSNRVGDFFGRISYSLYLLHVLILETLMKLAWMKPGLLSLAVFLTVACFVAWVSYTCFEAPCRKIIRQACARRIAGEPVGPAANA